MYELDEFARISVIGTAANMNAAIDNGLAGAGGKASRHVGAGSLKPRDD